MSTHEAPAPKYYFFRVIYGDNINPDDNILVDDDNESLSTDGFLIQYRVRDMITNYSDADEDDEGESIEGPIHTIVSFTLPRDQLLLSEGDASVNICAMLGCLNIPTNFRTSMVEQIYSAAVSLAREWSRPKILRIAVNIVVVHYYVNRDIRDLAGEVLGLSLDEEVMGKCVPATKSSIEALKKMKCSMGSKCVICLEDLSRDSEAAGMPCSHVYHHHCIVEWLERSHLCPLCRFEMPVE